MVEPFRRVKLGSPEDENSRLSCLIFKKAVRTSDKLYIGVKEGVNFLSVTQEK